MKAYIELCQLFEQHGRPIDSHAFLEHLDVQTVKMQLGHPLTCIFLCLLSQRCLMDTSLLERLLRYKNDNRLRDLEEAILELASLGFVINVQIIHALCYNAGKDTSFLPSAKLLHVAKLAGLLNAETNVVSDEVLRLLNIKKISLYKKLIEKSALDLHVLQNTSFSSLPSAPAKTDACVEFYAYAKLCECTAVLNTPNDKIDVLALWEVHDLVKILKELHETHRLTADIFLLACKVHYDHAYLLPMLELLEEQKDMSIASFCHHILSQGKTFSSLSALYKLLVLIERCDLAPINDELLQSLVILAEKLNPLLHSLNYLEQRARLTRPCFTWVSNYYEEQRRKESASSAEQANKKPRSALSYGLFTSKTTEKKPTFEIGAVLFALSQAHLLENESEWIPGWDNRWISECFTVERAEFIQHLSQLGELNQHSIYLARETHFDRDCLTQLLALAKVHAPFPSALPRKHVVDYLECLTLLTPFSGTLPLTLQQFAFDQPMLLKKILLLLNDTNGLTLDVILSVMNVCRQKDALLQYVNEIVFCTLLHWPMTEIEAMAASLSSSKAVFNALQLLGKSDIDISPRSSNAFVLPGLYQAPDPLQEVKILLALSAAHAFNQDTWALVYSMDTKIKASLSGMIQRLAQQGQCHLASLTLILSAKKSSVALEVFLLLTTEGLSVSRYWEALMQHVHPLLLSRGLVELQSRQILTAEYFLKIAQAKQPLLAAKALAQLLLEGIPLMSCWDEIADAENPEECAQMAMGSATPGKLAEDLPPELRNTVVQHTQPKLAQQHLKMLLSLSHLTTAHILQILPREDAGVIIQALIQLSELTPLSDALITLMIHNPKMLEPLNNYLSLGASSPESFTQLCQTSSVQEAENWLEREQLIMQHPHVAALLRESMADMSKHDHLIEALTLLNSVNEVNETSIAYLQRSSEPAARAEMMVALKKSGLYTTENIDRAIVRENQQSGVYKALHYLAEEGDLNALLFNFVMINSDNAVIEVAKHLMSIPNMLPAHFDWLATYPGRRFDNPVVSIINTLHQAKLLTRDWVEKIIQQVEPSLEDISNQLAHIPSALLDDVILEKIFTTYGICYVSDEENYYNPFEKFSENDYSLLTKEVIHLILTQPEGESYTVYYNMWALKQAELFQPDIIPHCTSKDRTNAIIALCKADQWNETNKAIVLASRYPQADALLIACLAQQNKYSQTTANLLLLRLELIQSNKQAKLLAGQFSYYFSKVLKDLLVKCPMLKESTIHCLLSTEIKWESMRAAILELIKDDALTDDSVCLMAMTDQTYLHVYLKYIYYAFDEKECHFADILKLCEYESYLNHPALLKVIETSVSYEARKKPFDTANMQQLLSDLWCLCQTGNQASVTERIQSHTSAPIAQSGFGYRS